MSGTTALTSQHPWPGNAPYGVLDRSYFHGRKRETEELLRLVRRDVITLVIGGAGVGKTSLIQAGLILALAEGEWLPISPHLDWSATPPTSDAPDVKAEVVAPLANPLSRTLIETLIATAKDRHLSSPEYVQGETLWEFFHRTGNRWWSSRQRVVTPIIVIDGFEQIFTVARENATAERQAAAFLKELSQLAANRPPQRLATRLETGAASDTAYDFEPVPLRIVFAMREEFAPRLSSLRAFFPAFRRSELRLEGFTSAQARDILMRGSLQGSLMSDATIDAVVANLAENAGHGNPILPAKLSALAYALAAARTERGAAQITPDFLPAHSSAPLPVAEASFSPAVETEDLRAELAQSEKRRRSSQVLSIAAIAAAVIAIAIPLVRPQMGSHKPTAHDSSPVYSPAAPTPEASTPPSEVQFSTFSPEYLPDIPSKAPSIDVTEAFVTDVPAPQPAPPPPPVAETEPTPQPEPAEPIVPIAPSPTTPAPARSALSPEAQRQVDAAEAERKELQRREFLHRQQTERRSREAAPTRKNATPAPDSAEGPTRKGPPNVFRRTSVPSIQ